MSAATTARPTLSDEEIVVAHPSGAQADEHFVPARLRRAGDVAHLKNFRWPDAVLDHGAHQTLVGH